MNQDEEERKTAFNNTFSSLLANNNKKKTKCDITAAAEAAAAASSSSCVSGPLGEMETKSVFLPIHCWVFNDDSRRSFLSFFLLPFSAEKRKIADDCRLRSKFLILLDYI